MPTTTHRRDAIPDAAVDSLHAIDLFVREENALAVDEAAKLRGVDDAVIAAGLMVGPLAFLGTPNPDSHAAKLVGRDAQFLDARLPPITR